MIDFVHAFFPERNYKKWVELINKEKKLLKEVKKNKIEIENAKIEVKNAKNKIKEVNAEKLKVKKEAIAKEQTLKSAALRMYQQLNLDTNTIANMLDKKPSWVQKIIQDSIEK